MCINCVLEGQMGDLPENPNPQEGRAYPLGWDLAGWDSPEPFGARVGSEDDDTLRMVYTDTELALAHMAIAQAFSGWPMEMFRDGQFICFRPAIVKRGKVQPPAWHVMRHPEGPEIRSEQDEIAALTAFEEFLRNQGIDPREILGEMPDPDED